MDQIHLCLSPKLAGLKAFPRYPLKGALYVRVRPLLNHFANALKKKKKKRKIRKLW